jgi:hypothetical protein
MNLQRSHNQLLSGDQPDDTSATAPAIPHEELVERVRQLRATALASGQRPPGRPALVAATGATEHQVRMALEDLAKEPPFETSSPPDTIGSRGAGSPANAPESVTTPRVRVASSSPPTRPWPLVIIGLAAAISVWSGWVGLGQLAGFGVIQPLPGLWDDLHLNSAIVLPISVEAYAAYAMRCWLTSHSITPRARGFARWSTVVSMAIGAGAQAAYHVMTAAGQTRAPWGVTVVVATIPVLVLGLATALASLIRVSDGPEPDQASPSEEPSNDDSGLGRTTTFTQKQADEI